MSSPALQARPLAALALLVCAACSGGDAAPGPEPVASISISPGPVTVTVGGQAQLSAETRSSNGAILTGRTVNWASGDQNVAAVSAAGLVRGVAVGVINVTASSEGRSAVVSVTVTPPPAASVVVTPNPASVVAGQAVQLTASARDGGGNVIAGKTFTWSSSNANVAAVDQSGRVVGVAGGTATITASVDNVGGNATVNVSLPPAASITVTPNPASVAAGGNVQLTASARDAANNVITGKNFVWSTSNATVASVDQTGRVTANAAGSANITATADGVNGVAVVNVAPPPAVVVTQVTPATLVEGQSAAITGSGFSATATANRVTIDGVVAQVTTATSTSLQIVVPSFNCRPRRTAPVQVEVGGQSSAAVNQAVSPASFLNMTVGQQVILQGIADRCLQFDAFSTSQRYVVGVQSVSEAASTVTGVTVNGVVPSGASVSPALPPPALAAPSGPRPSLEDLAAAERWSRHVEATVTGYERQRLLLQPLLDRGMVPAPGPDPSLSQRVPPSAMGAPPATAPTVPGTVLEGQQLTIRFPAFGGNTCTQFTNINVMVRKISPRGIFVEDLANPVSLAQSVYDQAAIDFATIYDIDVDYYGAPGDLDNNQRVVVVVTREVNRLSSPPLAFVSGGNHFLTSVCAASNEGEFFYMRAPDPTGQFNAGTYTVNALVNDFPYLLAHEFTHIIQVARRMAVGGQFMASWLAEGLATSAQEVVGFQIIGLQNGQNYGRNRIYASLGADPRGFFTYMGDLLAYFGFDFNGGHRVGAPEECTWVGEGSGGSGNPGPCAFATRIIYGFTWSLIKNAIDRYHGGATGQKAILRAFSDRNGPTGFADLEAVLGRPINTLVAEWAPVLYLDDRYQAAGFQNLNWNIRDIAAAWNAPTTPPNTVSNAELIPRTRSFSTFTDAFNVRAGSAGFYDISGANRPATSIRVRDAAGNSLPQFVIVWVVRVQ